MDKIEGMAEGAMGGNQGGGDQQQMGGQQQGGGGGMGGGMEDKVIDQGKFSFPAQAPFPLTQAVHLDPFLPYVRHKSLISLGNLSMGPLL